MEVRISSSFAKTLLLARCGHPCENSFDLKSLYLHYFSYPQYHTDYTGLPADLVIRLLVINFVFITASRLDIGYSWAVCNISGPKNWKKVDAQCGGTVQSPIDYKPANVTFGKTIGEITLEGYGDPTPRSNVTLLNNGHTLQVGLYDRHAHNMSGGSLPGKFTFAQIHFHWGNSSTEGSEHIVDGKAYPLEVSRLKRTQV